MEDQHCSSWTRNWNSTSENLLNECSNHLHLGQLELFRASIYSAISALNDADDAIKFDVGNLLETIYRCAHNYCLGSRTLEDPCRFYWLIAKLHQEICGIENAHDRLVTDAAFRDVSFRALPATSVKFVKELYGIHRCHVWDKKRPNVLISSECRKAFRELFKSAPDLAIAILQCLLVTERQRYFNHSLDLLQILYDAIDYELNQLEINGRLSSAWSNEADVRPTETSLYLFLTIGDSLCVPWNDGTNSQALEEFKSNVYELVMRLWHFGERNTKQKCFILNALTSQEDMLLLKMFCSVDFKNNKNRADQSVEGFLRFNIKDMFFFSVGNKAHFLEMIVNLSIELLCSGEQLLVKSVLSNPVLCRLKELVFLLSWSRVKNALDAIRITASYESMADPACATDPRLREASVMLLKKAQLVLRALESSSARKSLANACYLGNVLATLQRRSPLYILHSCHHLFALERNDAIAELESCLLTSTRNDAQPGPIIYTSFCLMYDLFQVVLASLAMQNKIEGYKQHRRKLLHESKDSLKEDFTRQCEIFYEDNVTKPLQKLQQRFSELNPIALRVELLENAFSLLFLTHRALQQTSKESSSDSERSETTGKKRKRNTIDPKTTRRSSESEVNTSTNAVLQSNSSSNITPTTELENRSFTNVMQCDGDNGSRFQPSRFGFIVSPFVIRDYLDCLQKCILDTRLISQGERLVSFASSGFDTDLVYKPDINDKEVFQRIARLSQYVNEAVWRLQLVTNSSLAKEICTFSAEDVLKSMRIKKRQQFQFYKAAHINDDDSGDDLLNKAGKSDVSFKEADKRISQRRQSSKRTSIALVSKSPDVVSKMLAQPDSLLNICLKQGDLTKASQVIQMFRLESTEQATEVEFAVHYKNVVNRLAKTAVNSHTRTSAGRRSRLTSEKSSSVWNTIVEAAQAGASTADTLIADELLASHKVPIIFEIEDFKSVSPINAHMPHSIDWKAFVRADLALVACGCIPVCHSLLENARSSLCSETVPCQSKGATRLKPGVPMKGIVGFVDDVLSLISLRSSQQSDSEEVICRCISHFFPSIKGFLMQGLFVLSGEEYKKEYRTWSHVAHTVYQLDCLLKSDTSCAKNIVNNISISPTAAASASLDTDKIDIRQHTVHSVFGRLQKLSSSLRGAFDEETFLASGTAESENGTAAAAEMPAYLSTFYEYAKRLSTIMHQSQAGVSQQENYFAVFQHSPSTIMNELLFDESASAEYLEKFSKQLGLDLLHAIVLQCCPKIPVSQNEKPFSEGSIIGVDREEPSNTHGVDHQRKMPVHLLQFIENRCWLAAVIVQSIESAKLCVSENDVGSEWALVLHPTLHRLLEFRGAASTTSKKTLQLFYPTVQYAGIKAKFAQLMDRGSFTEAMHYLDSWECQSPAYQENIQGLRDEVLSRLASNRMGSLPQWKYLIMITNSAMRAEFTLKEYGNWPIDGVRCALDVCVNDINLDASIRDHFRLLLRKAKLYATILAELQCRGVTWCSEEPSDMWEAAAKICSEPLTLLPRLRDFNCYSTILEWSCIHEIHSEEVKQIVDEVRLLSLLDSLTVNVTVIRQALERIADSGRRAVLCKQLLDRAREVSSDSILLQLLMDTEEFAVVSSFDSAHHKIGAKILRCLTESDRLDYLDLGSHPHFLIEQMLINIKIEPLQKAFQIIRDDLKNLGDDSPISFASLNTLLEIYAFKSVDFRVVQTMKIDTVTNAMQIPAIVDKNLHVFPLLVPTKDQWTPDASVTNCMVCVIERFSMFNRRHHCRRCGRVVCGQCSQQRICVDGYGDVAVRVCDDCYDHFATPMIESPHSLERRLKARFREASPNDGISKSKTLQREPSNESQLSRSSVWKLTINSCHNNTAREEFSYEQAPNISLCLSILDLHWDQHRSGLYLLDLADNMFRLLQPIEPRQPNPEIDYNLVINMLKSVLLSAKVKFSKSCDGDGVSRCELYLSLADLLEILLAANCKDLIPVGDLTQNDVVRRIRDQLIMEERWILALDVSTKGGLDVLGVWSAWGMACLRIGRYAMAREKFSFCLQRFKDQNKVTHINRLLQQILDQLASSNDANKEMKVPVVMTASLLRLRHIKEGNLKDKQTEVPIRKLDSSSLAECLYYLVTYGSRANYLAFCVKNGLWDEALRYTLEKKCLPALFIEEVVMPSIRRGLFFKLLASMKSTQLCFERWTPYLGPLCSHLERMALLNVLYDLQVFVKDYVRAAITCITFFRHRARDYSELYDRLHHLAAAKQHLELYIQLSGGTLGTTRHSLRMVMPIDEVHRHLRCIKIQVEVTKFIHEKLVTTPVMGFSGKSRVYSSRGTTPEKSVVPTVFEDSNVRAKVVAAVILHGSTIVEGFSLANRIIKEFKLHAQRVYSLVASELVHIERIRDVPSLISCLSQGESAQNEFKDDVLLKAIDVALSRGVASQEIDEIIKLLANSKSKIEAFMLCGKLKSAYLIAVKENNVEAIQRIQVDATRNGQPSVAAICLKWLSLNQQTSS